MVLQQVPEKKDATKIVGLGFDELSIGQQKHSKKTQEFNFLYLGRISRAKNIHLLVQWFHEYCLKNQDKKIYLNLAGNKDDSFQIRNSPYIKELGFLSEEEKYSIFLLRMLLLILLKKRVYL